MKQFFYILLILGLIYFCYWYITRPPEIIKVNGKVAVLLEDEKTNLYRASVSGTAENTGDFPATDIWIVYKIDDEEVTAYIGELKSKEIIRFRTGTVRIYSKNPEYELISVQYNN